MQVFDACGNALAAGIAMPAGAPRKKIAIVFFQSKPYFTFEHFTLSFLSQQGGVAFRFGPKSAWKLQMVSIVLRSNNFMTLLLGYEKKTDWVDTLVVTLLVTYLLFLIVGLARCYYGFKIGADYVIFEQSFYNTLNGRLLSNTFECGNHLKVHFSPILLLFVPVYALTKTTCVVMAISLLLLTWALWIFYRYGRDKGFKHAAALVVVFLVSHGTLGYFRVDFHALNFLPLPFIAAYISFQQKAFWKFVLWLSIIATIREQHWLLLTAWCVIALAHKRSLKWGLAPAGLALLLFVVWHFLIPRMGQETIRPSMLNYYMGYGNNWNEIFFNILGDPHLLFREVFNEYKLNYLFAMVLPFLVFTSFFRAWFLPAIPILTFIICSNSGRLAEPKLHYSIEIALWFALSSFSFLRDRNISIRMVTIALWIAILFFGFRLVKEGQGCIKSMNSQRYNDFVKISHLIPSNAKLVAERHLATHLARREFIIFKLEAFNGGFLEESDMIILESLDERELPIGWVPFAQEGHFFLLKRQ